MALLYPLKPADIGSQISGVRVLRGNVIIVCSTILIQANIDNK